MEALGQARMSLNQKDNGDGTITFSSPETGQTWPPIAKTEIARRRADAEARRAAIENAPDPVVQKIADFLVAAGVIDEAKATEVQTGLASKAVPLIGAR